MRIKTLTVSVLVAASFAHAQSADEFFEKKIRPVLVTKCQGCHNAKLKTAGLDLSTAAGFAAGGPSGSLLGGAESRLLKVISYEFELKMPPMGKLPAEDLQNLAAWVKVGAPWPGAPKDLPVPVMAESKPREWSAEQKSFWAFQPVKAIAPPQVRNAAWVQSPVDRFILEKLEAKAMQPAAPASREALIRRATFDLTGLPPTADEVRSFLSDDSAGAFATVVDRLLASPRYGERWGRHWLDVARYADSTGNDEDHRYPYAWRYRDYVIDAFNSDLPFNQFVREQLAGDLLPSSDGGVNRRGIIATGFLSLGPKALAQQDKQKMLYDVYDEQVDVTSRAFLGVTLACARCHDHKFDPLSTKDYYAMTGVFASTKSFANSKSSGVSPMLLTPLCDDSEYRTSQTYKRWLAAKQRSINEVYDRRIDERNSELGKRLADWMVAARQVYVDGKPVERVAAREKLDVRVLRRWVDYLEAGAAGRPHLEAWANANTKTARAVAVDYQTKYLEKLAAYDKKIAEWRDRATKTEAAMKSAPGKPSVEAEEEPFFTDVTFGGPFAVADARKRENDVVNVDKDKERQRKLEEKMRREREMTVPREELLTDADRDRLRTLRAELDEMRKGAPPEPEMADAVAEGAQVEQHVFVRGDYNSPGEVAPKSVPSILTKAGSPQFGQGSGRLELAEWTARADNPLTARVFVNRVWEWHFVDGLVRTPDNFGRMGERPTHPELLDWLAAEFVQHGWSVKQLHRTIMLSSAYQMSSAVTEQASQKDPENRLLSHFTRRRLEVEEIRDGLLAADGTIDYEMGGSLQKGFGTDGENSEGRLSLNPEKLSRRTVYIPLRRANLPTLLNLFDFGDATTVNGKRVITTVAPQALFAMNSEFVVERARNLAARALENGGLDDGGRLDSIYLRTLSRPATAVEKDTALTYINHYRQKFAGKSESEAWQSFCRALLGSNEFIYVD